MRTRMRRCHSCYAYTFKETCPRCGGPTENPLPPRYSPEDRYAEYRRRYRGECQ